MKDAALGIVLNSERTAVLLVQRRDVPVWVLPGGGIDEGETPEEAVVREVREEAGADVTVLRKVGEYLPINRLTSTAHLFDCHLDGGQLMPSEETRQVAFFPLKSLPKSLFCYHAEWLQESLVSTQFIRRPMSRKTFLRVLWTYAFRPATAFHYFCSRFNS